LSQQQFVSVSSSRTKLGEESARPHPSGGEQQETRVPSSHPSANKIDWDTEAVLDTAYNRLQELMQLLYLLSRDPTVPIDARYHVTVAQSEIALLSRVMQNSVSEHCTNARAHHGL
jgi:hypothetical protein